MSVEENKATVHRLVNEVFNKGNTSIIPELIAPGYFYDSPLGIKVKGQEGFAQFVGMARNAFPDLRMTVENLIGEGDKLAGSFTLNGTFTGNLGDIKPTGKKNNKKFAIFYRFENGKELEAVEFEDMLAFYQQLGIKP